MMMRPSVKSLPLIGVIWSLALRLTGQDALLMHSTRCRIRCGVVDENGSGRSLLNLVSRTWEDLKSSRMVNGEDFQFVKLLPQNNFTIDILIETYMLIGSKNVSVMIGPYSKSHVMAAEKLGLPFLLTSEPEDDNLRKSGTISVYPSTRIHFRIVGDLVRRKNWTSVAVLYDTNEGLWLLEELVRRSSVVVSAWKTDEDVSSEALRSTLMDIRRTTKAVIISHTSEAFIIKTLEQALRLGMLSSQYSWVAPFLGAKELEATSFADTGVTLFALRVSLDLPDNYEDDNDDDDDDSTDFTRYEYATVRDILLVIYQSIRIHHRLSGRCSLEDRGGDLLPLLTKLDAMGMTGRLGFDENGVRYGYIFDILSLESNGFQQVGLWNSSVKEPDLRLHLHQTKTSETSVTSDTNKTIKVVSILDPPFLMHRAGGASYSYPGSISDRYQGYYVDLLEALASHLGLKFDLYLVPDGQYGRQLPDGKWNGIINQLLGGKSTMALAPIAITTPRSKIIDFTDAFCTVSVGAVGRAAPYRSFAYRVTDPLAAPVWATLFAIMAAIGIILYFFDHLVPAGTSSPEAAGPSNEWRRDLPRCGVWFTLATILLSVTGGTVPRSTAGRLLISVLWVFSVAIISLYTAKMAAIMATSELEMASMQRLEHLLTQRDVSYGTVRHSDVSRLFQTSTNPLHVKMWQVMSEHDLPGSQDMFKHSLSDVTDTPTEGFERMNRVPNFHFIWHMPGIRFQTTGNCDLMTMESQLDSLPFGIALQQGSKLRETLNKALRNLSEEGVLKTLENKWWGGRECSSYFRRPFGVSLNDITGLLIILAVTVAMSTVVSVLEHKICRQRSEKKRNRRVPVKNSAVISTCDGVTSSNTVQMEEPFLPLNANAGGAQSSSTASRQTQIF